ncbi:MAG: PQQ-binding-like beta-propeller repeat protein [Chlorobi bacterium]|nr:PQQ-binding-like beta-propeller repeat protein [Chlorobiota bacterium]
MRVFLISIFFAVLFSVEVFGQNDWTMVNNGPSLNSFVQNETVLSPPLKVARTFNTTASEYALSGDYLIVGILGTPNTVKAFSWSSGAELWSFEIPGSVGGIDCAPAISGNLVLCGGQRGEGLYALNISDGSVAWMQPIGTLYVRNPVVYDGKVYVVGDSLYCFNLSDGSRLWSYLLNAQLTVAVDENNVYVPGAALDKNTGEKKYDIQADKPNVVIDESRAYYSFNNEIYAINKSDGSVVWQTPVSGGSLSFVNGGAIVLSDKYLCYIVWKNGDDKGELYALNKSDGSSAWKHTFEQEGAFTPRIANGIIYVVNWKSKSLWGLNLSDGSVALENFGVDYGKNFIIADHSIIISTSEELDVLTTTVTDVDDEPTNAQPNSFRLADSYPNPFSKSSGENSSTTIKFSIPSSLETQNPDKSGQVIASPQTTLKIYDVLGKEVATLVNKKLSAGEYEVKFNAVGLPAGIYFYQLRSGSFLQTKKMILLR